MDVECGDHVAIKVHRRVQVGRREFGAAGGFVREGSREVRLDKAAVSANRFGEVGNRRFLIASTLIGEPPLKVETRIIWIEPHCFIQIDDGTIEFANPLVGYAAIGKGTKIQGMGLQNGGACADPKIVTSVYAVLPVIGSRNCR